MKSPTTQWRTCNCFRCRHQLYDEFVKIIKFNFTAETLQALMDRAAEGIETSDNTDTD